MAGKIGLSMRRALRTLRWPVVVFALKDRNEALGLAEEIKIGTPAPVILAPAKPATAYPLDGVKHCGQAVFIDPQRQRPTA